jgi:hypothetical protein
MQIIFDDAAAVQLSKNQTILELETFDIGGTQRTAYCVVPADKIPLQDLTMLENLQKLHAAYVKALANDDFKLCTDIAEHLMGRFSGELDSFYAETLARFSNTVETLMPNQ